jgi:hypothetical protein
MHIRVQYCTVRYVCTNRQEYDVPTVRSCVDHLVPVFQNEVCIVLCQGPLLLGLNSSEAKELFYFAFVCIGHKHLNSIPLGLKFSCQ